MRLSWVTPEAAEAALAAAVEQARAAAVAVVFAYDDGTEGVDRPDLALPFGQDALVSAVAAANPDTVVVLNTGSSVTMPWLDAVRGVLELYYPGQMGGPATARLLFGDVNPSGRLTQTFPVDEATTPVAGDPDRYPGVAGVQHYSEGILVGYRWYDAEEKPALFPFGHGLSYTTFAYRDLDVRGRDRRRRRADRHRHGGEHRRAGPGRRSCRCTSAPAPTSTTRSRPCGRSAAGRRCGWSRVRRGRSPCTSAGGSSSTGTPPRPAGRRAPASGRSGPARRPRSFPCGPPRTSTRDDGEVAMSSTLRRAAGGAALALVVAAPAPAAPGTAGAGGHGGGHRAPVAATESGAVRGAAGRGVDSFLGIPFAAPPVGDLRWAAPRPAARWRGVRDATELGNRCPATESSNGPRSETEDCLFVNVQRPTGVHRGDRRPVFVFIHGGGLSNGSSDQMDMSKVVRETGVVGVTMNYRLGVFGFLGLPALTAEAGDSGNYGFADQQAALRWVRRNVAAFGGDPSRVTVGGESAGGWSVCGHLAAPGSRGLLAGAMIQSASCTSRPLPDTEVAGTAYAAAAGCSDPATVVACLRARPAGALLDAAPYQPLLTSGTRSLPAAPAEAVESGRFARVPVVNGANRDEGRTFLTGFIGAGQAEYEGFVRQTFGTSADRVLAEYPWPATLRPVHRGVPGLRRRHRLRLLRRHRRLRHAGADADPRPLDAHVRVRVRPPRGARPHPDRGLRLGCGARRGAGVHLAELRQRDADRAAVRRVGAAARARDGAALGRVREGPLAVAVVRPQRRLAVSLRAGGGSRMVPDAAYAAEIRCAFWSTIPRPGA